MKHVKRDLGPPMDDEPPASPDAPEDAEAVLIRRIEAFAVVRRIDDGQRQGGSGPGWSVQFAPNDDIVITLWDPRRGRRR